MTRLTQQQQIALLKARQRHDNLDKLLDSYDWQHEGYADKFAWLRDMFGPGRDEDLLLTLHKQFKKEGLL